MTHIETGTDLAHAARLWRARGAIVVLCDGWLWAFLPTPRRS